MRGTMEVLMVLNVGGLQEHGQIFKDLNECRSMWSISISIHFPHWLIDSLIPKEKLYSAIIVSLKYTEYVQE